MNNLAAVREIKSNYPAFQMSEEELIKVLENSLYPGAQTASIKMIIGYCRASNLDPMQKPVHIVPIWDSKAKTMRDVVMPGIGLYRSQASRSGEYAGVSEPEFGEDVTNTLDGVKITYPKWCRVTVKRLLPSGSIVEFTSKEFWIENYATKGRDSASPNSMWTKRPYAQLAKCAEAQALRKAFPEFGAQPTADEMEGKEIDITQQASEVKPEKEIMTDERFEKNAQTYRDQVREKGKSPDALIAFIESKVLLTEEQKEKIRGFATTIIENEVTQQPIDSFLEEMNQAESVGA